MVRQRSERSSNVVIREKEMESVVHADHETTEEEELVRKIVDIQSLIRSLIIVALKVKLGSLK